MTNMKARWMRSLSMSGLLITLGIAALLGGTRSLVVLIPVAVLVWYSARPALHAGRN